MMRFAEKVTNRIKKVGNHLCVGIDPHTAGLPQFLEAELRRSGGETFLSQLSACIVDAASGVAAVKFQSAFFEAFGAPGFSALENALKMAKNKGLLTILDAKRGDISSTMHAYGVAAFDRLGADALTVTAYMGTDVLEALRSWGESGHGIYVVWISSNPSGQEIQGAVVGASDETVAHLLQKEIDAWELRSNLSGTVGYVLGATKLTEGIVSTIQSQKRFFLLPGVGAQGGKVDATLLSLLEKHPGSLVSMSRSLTGLGFGHSSAWDSIQSWDQYTEAVGRACREAQVSLLVR